MPVYNDPHIRNKASYVGLNQWDYDLRDTTLTSPDYFGIVEFPVRFTAGKNLIKLSAHPSNLVPDSDIHIEILDLNGNPVYYEPLKYVQKDYVRVIAIWIFADTVPGPCTVYLSGRALRNSQTGGILPYSRNVNNNEYLNIPNVIWSRSIPISPFEKNRTEIIHLGTPRVHIKEIVQTYMKPVNMSDIVQLKSGSSAQDQTVLLRPITIGGTAGTLNMIPSTTFSSGPPATRGVSENAPAISIASQPALPGSAPALSPWGVSPTRTAGNTNNVPTSPLGNDVGVFVQGANAAASIAPGFGGNMLQLPQIAAGPALQQDNGGGLASVEFLGYTSFTGLSELEFTNFPLSESMEGGSIIIVNPNIDTDNLSNLVSNEDPSFIVPNSQHVLTGSYGPGNNFILSGIHQLSGSYEFKIVEVITTNKCHVQYRSGVVDNNDYIGNGDFQILLKHKKTGNLPTGLQQGGLITDVTVEPTSLDKMSLSSNFTSSHIEPYVLGFTEASQSFAEIIVSNMEPATGDVFKMKTQYKPGGAFGEYLDLGDTIVEHTHMLIDYNSMESTLSTGVDYNKIGHFSSLDDFEKYWDIDNFPIANENIATATFEPDFLMSGVKLTPAYTGFSSSSKRFSGMHLKDDFHVELTENTKYVLNLKGYVEDSLMGSSDIRFPYSRVDIYISGSRVEPIQGLNSFKLQNSYIHGMDLDVDDFDYIDGKFGTKICSIEIDGSGSIDSNTQVIFKSNEDKPVDLLFVVRRGVWNFAKINLFTHTDTGWSPNYTRQNIRIPTAFLKTPLAFKFSFYDYTGTIAEAQPVAYPITFMGENNYIDGTNNLITGSLFIGNSVGNGIEMAGVNSAFLRSIGYEGYGDVLSDTSPGGFMIYSGSVLPNKTNFEGDIYQGVGLELVADDDSSHLIFGTSPSILDVKTDKFFLGSTNQFISGALGNIEISSSNFHLDVDGSVVMQGTITATAGGSIGGFTLSDDALTATNFILDTSDNRLTLGSGTDIFIADADDGIQLGNATFASAPFSVTKAGVLKAESGTIGGWTLASDSLTGAALELNKSGYIEASTNWKISSSAYAPDPTGFISSSAFKVSSDGRITGSNVLFTGGIIAGMDFDDGKFSVPNVFHISASTVTVDPIGFISSSAFKVSADGRLTASAANIEGHIRATSGEFLGDVIATHINTDSGSIGGFTIGPSKLNTNTFQLSASQNDLDPVSFISSSEFKVSSDGRMTASAGEIAGWSFDNAKFTGGALELNKSGYIKSGTSWMISSSAAIEDPVGFISSSEFKVSADGRITGSNVLFDGGRIGGFSIGADDLTATNFTLDPSGKSISLGSSNDIFIVDGDTGMHLGNANFASAPFSVTKAGVVKAESGTIGGWTLATSTLTGGNMIIREDGTIESDGFVSNLPGSGFRLTAASGGMLEVENARIRGTLSTAVFEKETVNAVGGQLYVANSTTLTASAANPGGYYSAADTTMSVVNVSGFAQGEILTAKKIHSTGFATEYIYVNSASRQAPSSETDLSGDIYVIRGYVDNEQTSSLGDLVSPAQTYTGSQVIVSTGKIDTGYIRLNANPNDVSTPYIQIVERTGSGVYDLSLKAQLGDLSGITDSRFSDGVSGFGLYTENGYFSGKLEVSSLPTPPPSDKLLGYWPLDNLNLADASGLNLGTGSYAIVPNIVSGTGAVVGNAVECNGSNVINLAPASSSDLTVGLRTGNWSMVLWMTPGAPEGSYRNIIDWNCNPGGGGSGSLAVLEHKDDGSLAQPEFQFVFVDKNGAGSTSYDTIHLANPGSIAAGAVAYNKVIGVPIHIAITCDGEYLRYYENAVSSSALKLNHSLPFSSSIDPLDLTLFKQETNEIVDELRFYTGSLSSTQIEAIYTGNTVQGGGRTVIDGDSITSGHLRSNNFGTAAGSEFNLNDGTFIMGGTTSPSLEFDGVNLIVSGAISASSGGIGGFAIGLDQLAGTNFTLDTTNSSLILGSGNDIFIASASLGLQLGHVTFGSAPFSVTKAGVLKAESGTIGGWTLASDSLTGGALELNKSGYVEAGTSWMISSSAYAPDPIGFISSSAFKVSSDGRITGSNVLFTGGIIAGMDFDDGKFSVPNVFHISASTATADPVGFISSSEFKVSADGRITGSNVLFDGGRIASFSIDNAELFVGTKDTSGYASNNGDLTIGGSGIHTKNFFVNTSDGTAGFSGTLTIGGTDLDATNTLNTNTTADNVSLGNVDNTDSQGTAQAGLISGTTITGGGITLNAGGNIKGGQTAFDTGEGFFLGYSNSEYQFSIGNPAGNKLTWDGTDLNIVGDLEISTPAGSSMEHNFGGPSGSLGPRLYLTDNGDPGTGSQWYVNSNTAHKIENGVLFMSSSDNDESNWDMEIRSKQTFHRDGDHTYIFDFVINDISSSASAPRMMIGVGNSLSQSIAGVQTSKTYFNSAHALYFAVNDIKAYEGGTDRGVINTNGVSVGAYRGIIEPKPLGGARYQVFKYPNMSASISDFTSPENLSELYTFADPPLLLDAGIWGLKNNNAFHVRNIQVTAPGTLSTSITGDQIATGLLQSNNWDSGSGSEIDLNNGRIRLGGYTQPTFEVTTLGHVKARNFSTSMVVVDESNSGSYFKDAQVASDHFVDLIFDGSGGGDKVLHMQLDVAPFNVSQQAIKPILDLVMEGVESGSKQEVTITVNNYGTSAADEISGILGNSLS